MSCNVSSELLMKKRKQFGKSARGVKITFFFLQFFVTYLPHHLNRKAQSHHRPPSSQSFSPP